MDAGLHRAGATRLARRVRYRPAGLPAWSASAGGDRLPVEHARPDTAPRRTPPPDGGQRAVRRDGRAAPLPGVARRRLDRVHRVDDGRVPAHPRLLRTVVHRRPSRPGGNRGRAGARHVLRGDYGVLRTGGARTALRLNGRNEVPPRTLTTLGISLPRALRERG